LGVSSRDFYHIDPLLPYLQQGWTLLTPNFRLARRIKAAWDEHCAAQGEGHWPTAPVLAFESWIEQSWRRAVEAELLPRKLVLDGAREQLLWRQAVERWQQEHPAYALLQLDAAVRSAAQARDTLIRWRIDLDQPDLQQRLKLDTDGQAFSQWLRAFEQALEQGDYLTPADCAAQLLAQNSAAQERLLLVDFDDLPPLHHALSEHCASEVRSYQSAGELAPVQPRIFAEREQELRAVADWAFTRTAEDAQCTVGIVLLDMHADRATLDYHLRCAFDCLDNDYAALPVNFSAGVPLAQVPVVRDALGFLRSQCESTELSALVALLRSPFFTFGGDDQAAVALVDVLHNFGDEQISAHLLRLGAQQVAQLMPDFAVHEALYRIEQLRLQRMRLLPSQWLEPLCQVLDMLGWPGERTLDSLEFQQVELWYGTLEEFASLDELLGEMSYAQMLGHLQRWCEQQVSQPQTADSRIQVLGPLEAAGLQFDFLWLCGAEANRWPAPVRPNPFIPVDLQRSCGMPHASAEREWEYAHTLLRQYQRACGAVVASYAREVDGVASLPSGLLPSHSACSEYSAPVEGRAAQWFEPAEVEFVDDPQAPAMDAQAIAALRGGSATLEDQANCPFRAVARHRLKLRANSPGGSGLNPAERGSLLHRTLEAIWRELGDSNGLHTANLAALVQREVARAVTDTSALVKQRVGASCLELEQQRLEAVIGEWLELEKQRPPFKVVALERETQREGEGLILRLRIDRIDELSGGDTLLIDYKSSASNSLSQWFEQPPRAPQLPLYAHGDAPVAGVAWAQVKTRACSFRGLASVEEVAGIRSDLNKISRAHKDVETWDQLQQRWRTGLEQLARDFIAGEAAVAPRPGACDYCEFRSLCRIELEPGQ
jgi:probable DNA repair protein